MFKKKKAPKDIDAILLSYQDSVIRSVDLASLSTNSWITDSIIHFYYTYLEATSPSPEISLLSPSIIHLFLMLNRNHTSHEELITILPRSLVTCNFLFLPINNHRQITTGGTHWSLLIYSKLDECFFYYDSLRDSNYHYAKEVASYIIKLLNVKLCKIRCMNTPQQWNGSDCGVFLLILSEILYFRLRQVILEGLLINPGLWSVDNGIILNPTGQRERIKGLIYHLMENKNNPKGQ